MQILLVVATPFEIAPLRAHLSEHFTAHSEFHFEKNGLELRLLITGVGMTVTAYSLGQVLARQPFDVVINAGVAGAFDKSLRLGEVVNVVSERFADLGVEEADGSFTDLHQLGLTDPGQPPFSGGEMLNPAAAEFDFLPKRKGLTVNTVHGTQRSIEAVLQKYPDAGVESMEGAAVFLACLLAEQPFLEIRAISNYVEPRNRAAWDLAGAIDGLNKTLIELIDTWQSVQSPA